MSETATSQGAGFDPVVFILLKAKNLIRRPNTWVKKHMKRQSPESPNPGGYAYCALGALDEGRALLTAEGYSLPSVEVYEEAERYLIDAIPGDEITTFNDSKWTSQGDVQNAFDIAIRLRRAQRA